MPRNGSGVYTLPIGNPVEPNTIIEAEWANTTLEDVGDELTNSLSRTGEGGMLAPFRLFAGTSSSPGLAWLNETSSGFYRAGTGEFWATVLAIPVLQYTQNGILIPSGKTLTAQGNATIGGTLGVTGLITASGGISGSVVSSNVTITGGTINGTPIGGTTRAAGAFTTLSANAGITGDLTGNVTGNVSGNAGTVTNGVYTTGTYANPAWITSLAGSKITGDISGNAANVTGTVAVANGGTGAATAAGARTNLGLVIGTDVPSPTGTGASGTWSINVSGNAGTVTNGVYTSGSYANPSWITSLAATKVLPSYTGNALRFLRVNSGGTDIEWAAESGLGTVTSVDVSGGTTGLTTSGGPVTSSGTITLAGTLNVANGGTGATTAAGARTALSVPSTTGSGATGTWSIDILGQAGTVANGVYTTGSYSDPAWLTSLAGSKITGNISGNAANVTGTVAVANGGTGGTTAAGARGNLLPSYSTNAGKVLAVNAGATDVEWITVGGSGTVTSVSGTGTVNGITLTGTVTSSGSLTLGGTLSGVSLTSQVTGTLPVANGGTGLTTTPVNGALDIGNGTGFTRTTLSAGTGISVTNGAGSITIAATNSGTVTSVNASGGTTGLSFSGGPITTTGTLTLSGTLAVANGGTGTTSSTGSGSVVLATSPTLTTPNLGTPSAATLTNATGLPLTTGVTGILPVANGGTGQSSYTANGVVYASATNTLATGTALVFNGTQLGIGKTSPTAQVHAYKASGDFNALDLENNGVGSVVNTYMHIGYGGASFYGWRINSANNPGSTAAGTFSIQRGNTTTFVDALTIDNVGKVSDANGAIRAIPQSGSAKTGSYTLATTDVGLFIQVSTGGSITIPNSTFSAGDVVSVFNNTSGNITVTCSTTNAYIAGTDTNKTSVTLATRGVMTVLFVTSTLCVISGNVS